MINESNLTKGHLRKLNALRKAVGNRIADSVFAEWLASQPQPNGEDKTLKAVREAIEPMVLSGSLRIPRGGITIRRGRGRVLVDHANA